MMTTEYAVQAMSRSTGASGRWVNLRGIFHRRADAERLAAERAAANKRVVYRVVSRYVTQWADQAATTRHPLEMLVPAACVVAEHEGHNDATLVLERELDL